MEQYYVTILILCNTTMEHLKIKFIRSTTLLKLLVGIVWFFLFCQDTGVFFCDKLTDVGFGGWENIWEIMCHSANVTKYVGLEPLRPSSIILLGGVPDVFWGCFLELGAILGLKAKMTSASM